MRRVLLLGGEGMLGTDIAASAPAGIELVRPELARLDITDPTALAAALHAARPEWVVNAAAYTQVDRAEGEYDAAVAVNGTAVTELGRLCAAAGIRVIHFSTDYVFRGDARRPYREDDPTDPVNAYGRSKLAGEDGLRAAGARSLIIRTQWLYGQHGRSFPRTMWERARRGSPTRVVSDQYGSLTSAPDLARATWDLIARDAEGLYHVVGAGIATWFEVAQRVFRAAGAPELVSPCLTAEYPTPAARPMYSVLDATRVADRFGIMLPTWTESLDRFLDLLGTGTA